MLLLYYNYVIMNLGQGEEANMPNILLTRIDNRLVHGQVGVTWMRTIGANLIIVADNVVAENPIQQDLMRSVVKSSGVGIRFFSLDKTAEIIHKAAPNQKIFIVCRTPKDVLYLIENGVPINNVNVGNMHFSKGKTQLSKKVYVDDEDKRVLKLIEEKVDEIYIQDIPGGARNNLEL